MRRSRRARLGAAAVSIFAVAFAVGAWVIVPLAAGKALEAWAAAEPGRAAAARRATVNPFTLTVTLHDLALDAPAVSLAAERVAVDFGIASLLGSVAALDALTVDGVRVRLGEPDANARAESRRGVADLIPSGSFAIARAAVSGGRVEWLDEGEAPLVLAGLTARAFDLDNYTEAPARFEIDVRNAGGGGVLRLNGEAVLGAPAAAGRVHFENLNTAQIARRLFAAPSIAGMSSGTAEFEWHGGERGLRLRNAALRMIGAEIEWPSGSALSAASLEAAGDAELGGEPWRIAGTFDLLRAEVRDPGGRLWLDAERLAASGAEAELERGGDTTSGSTGSLELASRAFIDTLSLSEPRATIVVNGGGEVPGNRALDTALGMLSGPRANAAERATSAETTARPAGASIAAGRIELEGGVLDMVDAGLGDLRPSLRAVDVHGVIERGEDQDPFDLVVADLTARIGAEGSAALRLRAAPGDDARKGDVMLDLVGVPAGIFAAHASRFAGYALEGGLVDAAIDYRVDADGINGTARIGARGAEIEPTAETADDVDVALALALLEDAHGLAETAVGFHAVGDSAGIGPLLAAAVLARLDAIAAAPFDALGEAVGVDGETLAAVSFPPGEAAPSEPATIDALAEALHARPRIGLRVQGVASRELDRDALAAQQIELHVTLATAGPTLVARPQPVDFDSPRHRDVLDEFAGERLGDEERETIASYFTRTPDGRIVEDERSAYYRALFDALVENEEIPDSGIERLARYRARAITDGLAARGVAQTRIETAPVLVRSGPEATGEAGDGIEAPLEVVMAPSSAADSQRTTASAGDETLDRAALPRASD